MHPNPQHRHSGLSSSSSPPPSLPSTSSPHSVRFMMQNSGGADVGRRHSLHSDNSLGMSTLPVSTAGEGVSAEQCIHNHYEQRREEIHDVYDTLDVERKGYVTLGDLTEATKLHGLDPVKNKEVKSQLQELVSKHRSKTQQHQQHYNGGGGGGGDSSGNALENGNHDMYAFHRIQGTLGDASQDLRDIRVEFEDFYNLLSHEDGTENIIQRAFTGKLAIPNWTDFCSQIVEIFEEVQTNKAGRNADYIPQLNEVDPELYGCSICTVDGQRFSVGDYEHEFTLQSCSKVFSYCIACEENGVQEVHKHIGVEPSGASFNAFTLDDRSLPHNPMINAGAIVNCSLIKPKECASKRFMYVNERFSEMAGGAKMNFDNATFLSEKDTADRNFALAYYMNENQVFPTGTNLEETLDFYFQICSMLISCEKLSVMASTLANAGTCPLTEKRVAAPENVKCALQLMYSCGMYDYSGEWACAVGLPAKSGVSGAICIVIPGVMGMTVFSPRLDKRGNSVRGVEFCRKASQRFKWSIFDRMVPEPEEDEELSEVKRHSSTMVKDVDIMMAGDGSKSGSGFSEILAGSDDGDAGNETSQENHAETPSTVIRSGTKRNRSTVDDISLSNDHSSDEVQEGNSKRQRHVENFSNMSQSGTPFSSPAFARQASTGFHPHSPLYSPQSRSSPSNGTR